MTDSLFREQAIEEQKANLYGEVVIRQPVSITIQVVLLAVIVIAILVYLTLGSYSRKETVSGYLVPDKGLVKVYAPAPGVLTQVHVEEGQQVNEGDVLITVSTLKVGENAIDQDALLISELSEQKFALSRKLSQEEDIHNAEVEKNRQQVLFAQRELKELDTSLRIQQEQVALSQKLFEKVSSLVKEGHSSAGSAVEAERDYLRSQDVLQTTRREKLQLEKRVSELSLLQQRAPLEWSNRKIDIERAISELDQRIIEVSGRRVYTIRSPINGKLTALQVATGQTVNPQTLLTAILPDGATLEAELFLPTRSAGFSQKGQQVLLRYEAFPYQKYGLYEGRVESIAQVILTPNELPIPVALTEPVYRVTVSLDSQNVSAYGKNFPLQAGMLLNADIVLEERSLLEWLLEPILGLRGNI